MEVELGRGRRRGGCGWRCLRKRNEKEEKREVSFESRFLTRGEEEGGNKEGKERLTVLGRSVSSVAVETSLQERRIRISVRLKEEEEESREAGTNGVVASEGEKKGMRGVVSSLNQGE